MDKKQLNKLNFTQIYTGGLCNHDCIHCYIDEKKGLTNKQEIISLIHNTKENSAIDFIGGEPTLLKDIIEFLKISKEKNLKTILHSNGTRFNKNFLTEIEPYIDIIILPIHSHNIEIFNKITQRKTGEKIIQSFKDLRNYDIELFTQTVINKLNYKNLLETFDFIQNIQPNIKMNLTFPHTVGGAASKNVSPTYTESWQYIQKVISKYYHLIQTQYIPLCILYPYHDKVLNWDISDIDKKQILFESDKILEIKENVSNDKIKSEKCKECIFDNKCPGVWKEYYELYGFIDINPIIKHI